MPLEAGLPSPCMMLLPGRGIPAYLPGLRFS